MYPDVSSPDPPTQSSSAPRRDSTSTTKMLMGKCVLLGEETRGGSERNWGPHLLPQTRSLKYVCPELGPACIGPEGGGTAHPPACGVSPEQEEGPPLGQILPGPLLSLEGRSPQASAPTAPSSGQAGWGMLDKRASQPRH